MRVLGGLSVMLVLVIPMLVEAETASEAVPPFDEWLAAQPDVGRCERVYKGVDMDGVDDGLYFIWQACRVDHLAHLPLSEYDTVYIEAHWDMLRPGIRAAGVALASYGCSPTVTDDCHHGMSPLVTEGPIGIAVPIHDLLAIDRPLIEGMLEGAGVEQRMTLYASFFKGPVPAGYSAVSTVAKQTDPTYEDHFEPHVIVAVPDSGIDPYHEAFYRPERTEHPCTYLRDLSCNIKALPLTVGTDDPHAALAADAALWDSVEPGEWYWIPQTVFVAVGCQGPYDSASGLQCILDDTHPHGTQTVSTVLAENPDALIAFAEVPSANFEVFTDGNIPYDVVSFSWGHLVPVLGPYLAEWIYELGFYPPIFVAAAGNDPLPALLDYRAGDPGTIVVGGAAPAHDGRPHMEETFSRKQPDVVSYHCRPVADSRTWNGTTTSCGTSFATPTVAGALSKVILELRHSSGYSGTVVDGQVDPIAGVTVAELRHALNATATYDPVSSYEGIHTPWTPGMVPRNDIAPWSQWGWGFYQGTDADETLAYLRGEYEPPAKPEAQAYMSLLDAYRRHMYRPLDDL